MENETNPTADTANTQKTIKKYRRRFGLVILAVLGIDFLCGTICNFRNCAMLNDCVDFPYIREELAGVGVDAEPYDGTGIGQKIGRFVSHEFSTLLERSWLGAVIMGKWDQVSFCQYLSKERKLIGYVEGAVGFSMVSREQPRPSGEMSPPDLRQGIALLEIASRHGVLHSTCVLGELHLGVSYLPGEDIPSQFIDEKKAIELLTTATQSKEKNVAGTAFYRLGQIFSQPDNKACDAAKAVDFLQKAYERGISPAAYELAQLYKNGCQNVAIDLLKTIEWLEKAAAQNNLRALNELGEMYFYGNGIWQDEFKAYNLWLKAASLGDAAAQRRVGVCHEVGAGCSKDSGEMFRWYKSAAEKGDPVAQFKLGDCCQNGRGTDADIKEAFVWFEKAAQNGQADGQMRYAGLLLRNIDGTARYREGLDWLEKSAAAGVPEAQLAMGLFCYAEIKGLEVDSSDGGKWFGRLKSNKNTPEEIKTVPDAISMAGNLFGKEAMKQQARLSLQQIFPNLF